MGAGRHTCGGRHAWAHGGGHARTHTTPLMGLAQLPLLGSWQGGGGEGGNSVSCSHPSTGNGSHEAATIKRLARGREKGAPLPYGPDPAGVARGLCSGGALSLPPLPKLLLTISHWQGAWLRRKGCLLEHRHLLALASAFHRQAPPPPPQPVGFNSTVTHGALC